MLKPFVKLSDDTIAQRVIYAVSVLLLCIELLRCSGRPLLTSVCALALLFNIEVNRYHFAILTESLFLSMSALFVACALAYLRSARLTPLIGASLFVGALIAIRPTGLGFVPALLVLPFCRQGGRPAVTRLLAAALVPMLAVVALESAYYRAYHPGPRQSLAPIQILGKAGLVEAPDAASLMPAARPDARPLMQALQETLAPVRRLIAQAPNEAARCQLIESYEAFMQYRFAPEQRKLATATRGPRALAAIGLARLRHGVPDYLRLSVDEFYCLWTLSAASASEREAFKAYLSSHRSLPFEADILPGLSAVRLPPAALLVRWTMLAVAALLAAAVLALLIVVMRRRRPGVALAVGGICGLAVHATCALTALAGIGIPRYLLSLWVPLALGTAMSALWLWQTVLPRGDGLADGKLLDQPPALTGSPE